MTERKICSRCLMPFMAEPVDEEHPQILHKLCYVCFEESLEEYEERKRERIARENEY